MTVRNIDNSQRTAEKSRELAASHPYLVSYALYRFRHHWKFSIKRAKAVKFGGKMAARVEEIPRAIPVNENAVNDARDWIRSAQPSLEEIEQRADAEGR